MPTNENRIAAAIKLLEDKQVERDKAYRKTRDPKEADAITTLSKALEHLDTSYSGEGMSSRGWLVV